MGKILWLHDPSGPDGGLREKWTKPTDGSVFREIRVAPGPTAEDRESEQPLAYPEQDFPAGGDLPAYRNTRKRGARAFVLWADPHRAHVFARVATKTAAKGEAASYEVLDANGAGLGTITRESALKGGHARTCWTVRQAGQPTARGLKGNPFWWFVWWLISPIQMFLGVLSLIAGGNLARMPRRTKWRADGELVLDYRNGAGLFELEVLAGRWDPRVTAALVALLGSHDGLFGSSWDESPSS